MFELDKNLVFQLFFLAVVIISLFIVKNEGIKQGRFEMCKELNKTYLTNNKCIENETFLTYKHDNRYIPQIDVGAYFG